MGLTDKPIDTRTPAQRVADQILRTIPAQADAIERVYVTNYDRIWHTPNVDPQDVLDALGSDAAAVFSLSVQVMSLVRPEVIRNVPDQYAYTIHGDGTITLTPVDRSSPSSASSESSESSFSSLSSDEFEELTSQQFESLTSEGTGD